MDLVTGASGYIGGLLVDRLSTEGRPVRAAVRDPARLAPREGVEAVRLDLVSGEGLVEALDGCETAYYLVHSMERTDSRDGDFAARDRTAARNFVAAATAAGVRRAVYLGGIAPPRGTRPSRHMASRLEVEDILLNGLADSVAFRASIVIGAHSDSFRILVRLVERLRMLPFPTWRRNRTAAIDERDAIEFLARAPAVRAAAGRSLDIAGPDVLSYGEMIRRIAELMGVGRLPVGFGSGQTPAAAAVVAAVTGRPVELVRPLMESLATDLLPRDGSAAELFGLRPRTFSRAVEHALADWERAEPLAAR
ncbi:MAG: NAD(P)H-binding protein [Actinobacteria bacterium]|nr:NAD(P)H-binding protein [Actinomycetota bacterium]